MKHTIALAALVASTMGLATALPAVAQSQAPTPPTQSTQQYDGNTAPAPAAQARPAPKAKPGATQQRRGEHRPTSGHGMVPGDNVLALVCSDRGAEALAVSFVRLTNRLTLTADQQKLFDALKTKATSTQADFANQCKTLVPAATAEAMPDMVARLKGRIAIDKARLSALEAILPDFEAFYGSLTDAQKKSMAPSAEELNKRAAAPARAAPGRAAPGR